jgi:hypothetical protein
VNRSEQPRLNIINKTRRILARAAEKELVLCRQETWNMSLAQVRETLENPQTFLDASRFLSLFEQVFRCRLVVFTKTNFKQPYFSHGFLRAHVESTWPIVVVYENIGGEAQHADYPQYELVEGITNLNSIYDLYVNSLKAYTFQNGDLSEYQKYTESPTIILTKIEGQFIDVYGKVFALNILTKEHTGIKTFFLHTPIAPVRNVLQVTQYKEVRNGPFDGVIYDSKLGSLRGYFQQESENVESPLNQFLKARRQVKLLVENAKHMYSKNDSIKYDIKYKVNERTKLIVTEEYINTLKNIFHLQP